MTAVLEERPVVVEEPKEFVKCVGTPYVNCEKQAVWHCTYEVPCPHSFMVDVCDEHKDVLVKDIDDDTKMIEDAGMDHKHCIWCSTPIPLPFDQYLTITRL